MGRAYLEGIELDVGVAVREALDDALHDLLGAIVIPAHPIAQVDDSSPVFGGEILVGRLGYMAEQQLGTGSLR